MSRFLITTADERTWRFDRPVLFLGEFCRLYDRRSIWHEMDAVVAEPYGLDSDQRERDLAYIERLYAQLIPEVSEALNAYHGTRHSRRYWTIVLGHWLRRYVMIAFNRYFTVEQALRQHDVSTTAVLGGPYCLATTASVSLVLACNDDTWNHFLFARVLQALGSVKIEVDTAHPETRHFAQLPSYPKTWKTGVRRLGRSVANTVLSRLARDRDAFIINSYLPLSTEIRLQLSLGQCPQLWESPPLNAIVPDSEKRRRFDLNVETHVGFEAFVRRQLGAMIPGCFLEGYEQLVGQVAALPWPARPRFIFTSNNFDTDEVFKVWTGSKVEAGVPYFTGQHGNSYGTHLYAGNVNWPERSDSDRFLTWGWSDESPNTVAAFNFKSAAPAKTRFDQEGGLLLVELCPPHRETPWDLYSRFGAYQEDQFRFVSALPDAVHQRLTVRLHSGYRLHRWSDEQRWRDRSPNTRVDTAKPKIHDLIRQSRLIVHSYDGTGVLESLSSNIPTLCFWDPATDLLLPSAKPYYQLLRSAGILLDTPEKAAETVARHWGNVGGWWGARDVQQARETFCEKYARSERYPVRTMSRLLQTPRGMDANATSEEAPLL